MGSGSWYGFLVFENASKMTKHNGENAIFLFKIAFFPSAGVGVGAWVYFNKLFRVGSIRPSGGGQCVPKSVVVTAPTDLVFKLNLGGGRFLLRIESNYRSVGTTTLS